MNKPFVTTPIIEEPVYLAPAFGNGVLVRFDDEFVSVTGWLGVPIVENHEGFIGRREATVKMNLTYSAARDLFAQLKAGFAAQQNHKVKGAS